MFKPANTLIFQFMLLLCFFCFSAAGWAKEKEPAALGPMASLGKLSEAEKQILYTSLQEFLSSQYSLASQKSFEVALTQAFEELEYEECTEDQCFALIQQILQVDNLFLFNIIREGTFTQLSLTRVDLDSQRLVKTAHCENCGISQLNQKIRELVQKMLADASIASVIPNKKPISTSNISTSNVTPDPVFSLDDIENKAKEQEALLVKQKTDWQKKQQKMNSAFEQVQILEPRKISYKLKVEAWSRFLRTFMQNNPYSSQDEKQRKTAKERIAYWKTEPQRIKQETANTVVDPKTGLMWQKGETEEMRWYRAKQYCLDLTLAGYNDWRLPNKDTLQNMFAWKEGGHYSKKDLHKMFPDIQSSDYWSSTTRVQNTSYVWYVNFSYGYEHYNNMSNSYYFRCVRGGS